MIEKLEDVSHWTVESTRTVIAVGTDSHGQQRTWQQNHSTEVVATNVHRALAMFTETYPDDVVHVVRKTSRIRTVLIDREP